MTSTCLLKNRFFKIEAGPLLEPPVEVIDEEFVGVDTETEVIVKGCEIKPVIMQVCYPKLRLIHIVEYIIMDVYLYKLLQLNPKLELVFHNMPFDLKVLNWTNSQQLRLALKEGRLTDIGIRFILKGFEDGTFNETWGLDYISSKLLGVKLDKNEDIRLGFKQNRPLTLPEIEYAAKDSAATAMIREILTQKMPTELVQNLGHIVLTEIGNTGMLVDRNYLRVKRAEIDKKLNEVLDILSMFGFYPHTKGNATQVQKLLAHIEEVSGIKFPRTDKTDKIQATADILKGFGENAPPFIEAFRNYTHYNKFRSTYLNEDLIGPDGRVHPYFSPMMRTGRTSCSGPNIQNVPRKEEIRGIYIAPPGYVLLAVDYSQLELRVLAEQCFQLYGQSRMMELLNSGVDLHMWFGKEIMKVSGRDPDTTDKKELKEFRQMAKSCSFGYPGGLGPETFIEYARTTYDVHVDLATAKQLKELWLQAFPEMKLHLRPMEDTITTERNLRNYLRKEFPDVAGISSVQDLRDYLKLKDYEDKKINQIIGEEIQRYMATTVAGMTKRDCTYCAGCNYGFQSGAATGAKLALWYVYSARHKIVNFIHDEIITEQRLDDKLQENVQNVSDLMIKGMKHYLKHVDVAVEASLMTRWNKDAKEIKDADGNLQVWYPPTKKEKVTSNSMMSLLS